MTTSALPPFLTRVLTVAAVAALGLASFALAGGSLVVPGFAVDPLSGLVLVLVFGVGATVLGYSVRALRHEPYLERFALVGSGLVAACAALVLTTNLIVLAGAWLATSALTLALVRIGPAAGVQARSVRARRAFLTGDVLVVGAVGLLVLTTDSAAIGDVGSAGSVPLAVAGTLLVLAALTRSASGPWYGWLPDSLGAPTPASALLHAGVVSSGAIVLIKLEPAVAGTWPAAVLALAIGGATCVFAEAVMLTRPDVKGRLAWSTIAQMSFTVVLCGLGLPVAAGVHLVAHGFYKSTLFLGSGSAVRGLVRQRTAPPRRTVDAARRRGTWALAFGASAATVLGAALALGAPGTAEIIVPLGLAVVAGACATAAAVQRSDAPVPRLLMTAAIASMLIAFVAVTVALDHALVASLAGTTPVLAAAWVLPVLAGLVLVALTRDVDPAAGHALARVWTAVRVAGRPKAAHGLVTARPLPMRAASAPVPTTDPALAPSLTGV